MNIRLKKMEVWFVRYRKPVTVAIAALLIFLWMILAPSNGVVVEIRLQSSKPGTAQLYYDKGHGFQERLSQSRHVKVGMNQLRFDLPTGDYRALRFDPINKKSTKLSIYALQIKPSSRVSNAPTLGALHRLANISGIHTSAGRVNVTTTAANGDPQLGIALAAPLHVTPVPRPVVLQACMALLLALVLVPWARALVRSPPSVRQIAVFGMAVALVLIVVMDIITIGTWNMHPDEPLHLSCFEFFLNHAWPVKVGAPAQVASLTTSPFGTSYLNQWDVVYFLSGHAMQALAFLFHSPLAMARTFQHILWLGLLLIAVRRKAWSMALAAALVSPQIWYVFSYYNGDAFPLFLGFIAAALVAQHDGGVQRYLGEDASRIGFEVVLLGLCLGALVVSKSNSMPVVLGIFLWLGVQHVQLRWRELIGVFCAVTLVGVAVFTKKLQHMGVPSHPTVLMIAGIAFGLLAFLSLAWRYVHEPALRPKLHRLFVLFGLVVLFAAPRIVDDVYLNGLPQAKAAAITKAKEAYGAPQFKPSVLASGKGFKDLEIARKGVSLQQMLFSPLHWFKMSARSAYGTYGYMSIWSSRHFYMLAWLFSLALSGYMLLGVLRTHTGAGHKLAMVAICTAMLIVLSSVLFSWVVGFQPQGRYLLPVAVLLAMVMGSAGTYIDRPPARILLLGAFLLSTYSYLFTGIAGMVRHI